MRKEKKKSINVLTLFSFPIKVMSKLSLTGFLASVFRALVSIYLTYLIVLNKTIIIINTY